MPNICCPECGNRLEYKREDDGYEITIINLDGTTEIPYGRSNGGDYVRCSFDSSHSIPEKLCQKVRDIVIDNG